jgi:anti-anti-sigma factor
MPNALEATVRQEPGVAVITLTGTIDREAEPVLGEAWDRATASADPSPVMLDFSAVSYINSTGIAVIVGLLARARAARRSLIVFGLTDHYRHVFEITRLSDFMQIHSDESAARESAGAAQQTTPISSGGAS